MPRHEHLFNFGLVRTLGIGSLFTVLLAATLYAETNSSGYAKRDAGLYQDVFDQNIYYEGTQILHLERLYRLLSGTKKHALNVNTFDEVPDSSFFTNRHGRSRLSAEELKKGPQETNGPDLSGPMTITKGKFEGITPGFFVKDAKGDKYLLKFDPLDYLELATGAEIVASRFMHALGYNVPQYTVLHFKKEQLAIAPGAQVYDESGFKKELTSERLEEFLIFVPETSDGSYRASASKILGGEILGPMHFQGRRYKDRSDWASHKDLREIRALQVFSAWLNNSDVRESNSLDVYETKDGVGQIRHYLIDFNSSLGARPAGPKVPMFGHEHMIDYGETLKAILSFGLWKKPWQKRWDEVHREVKNPTVGYFDNRHFEPRKYRTQLPHYSFKDLTRADGFWAAKQIAKFTDEDIREIVSTGQYTDAESVEEISRVLIERRDLLLNDWFNQANPLDDFQLFRSDEGIELRFEDLAVRHKFEKEGTSTYQIDVIAKNGKKGIRLAQEEIQTNRFLIRSVWLEGHPSIDLLIRTRRDSAKEWSPFVRVEIRSEAGAPRISSIFHQD